MLAPYASLLDELYATIESLAAKVGIRASLLPSDDRRDREDGLWIANMTGGFTRYYMERGQRIVLSVGNFDTTLFEVMRSAAFDEAVERERRTRIAGEDSRRQLFQIQRDLMGAMNAEWRDRVDARQSDTLAKHPYRDDFDLA